MPLATNRRPTSRVASTEAVTLVAMVFSQASRVRWVSDWAPRSGGVVDVEVEPTEGLGRLGDHPHHIRLDRHVGEHRMGAHAFSPQRGSKVEGRCPVGDRDVDALIGKGKSDRPANARGCPGHQGAGAREAGFERHRPAPGRTSGRAGVRPAKVAFQRRQFVL